ncbi:unnamed protein product, partial [Hapterophycus canaliculatus]
GGAGGVLVREGLDEDEKVEKSTAGVKASDAAAARAWVMEREKRALVEKAMLLFDLFDADGSGAIDREELTPLLRQLGIWVSPDMERNVFPRLDLDCSGDVKREELAAWLEKEGGSFRHTVLSLLLRCGQTVGARGSSTRRLQNQVRASMIARSRAAARAEAWAASGALVTGELAGGNPATADTYTTAGTHQHLAEEDGGAPEQGQQRKIQDNERPALGEAAVTAVGAAAGPAITGGRKRGRALAAKAAGRRRRIEEREKEADRELLVTAAEDEAERRVKGRWRTQAGAAELRREEDRIRGAEEGLHLTLRAWDGLGRVGFTTADRSALRRKQTEEKLRHLFRLFDSSCDGCIDAEELGRLLSRLNYPMSEHEIVGLLDKMDGDGSGDVDFSEFSAWWHEEGLRRSKRPGALIRSAASSLAATVTPMVETRRDAQRALISRARAEARAEVKEIIRLENSNDVRGDGVVAALSPKARERNALSERINSLAADAVYGDTVDADSGKRGHGSRDGGGGYGVKSSLNRERLAAGRASKLARAEAEAYADVQATIRTSAGKRELARRTCALRMQWKAAIKTAEHIALENSGRWPLSLRAAAGRPNRGTAARAARDGYHFTQEIESERPSHFQQQQQQRQQPAPAELVEVPFLRFLWGVHGTTTGRSATAAAVEGGLRAEVEPSELKYLGASLRHVLTGGGSAARAQGAEINHLASTLALGRRSFRTGHFGGSGVGDGGKCDFGGVVGGGELVHNAAGERKGEILSLRDVFDDPSDDPVRNLKTLTSGSMASVNAIEAPAAVANVVSSTNQRQPRIMKDRTWLADRVVIARMKKMLLAPGAFRRLAKEAMLAEGRAFER